MDFSSIKCLQRFEAVGCSYPPAMIGILVDLEASRPRIGDCCSANLQVGYKVGGRAGDTRGRYVSKPTR